MTAARFAADTVTVSPATARTAVERMSARYRNPPQSTDELLEVLRQRYSLDQVNRVRRAVFGGTDDKPLQHLGEAETCVVIKEWAQFVGSWWISDDCEALRYARFQGITTYETIDLLSMAVADGDVTDKHAYEVMVHMSKEGRSLRLPRSASDLRR